MLNQRGEVKFTTILLIVALVIGAYIVIRIAPVYIRNFQISNVAETAAKFAADPSKKETVPGYLKRRIYDNELPVEVEDFVIEEADGSVYVTIDWQADVAFIPENPIVPPVIRTYSFHDEAVAPINR